MKIVIEELKVKREELDHSIDVIIVKLQIESSEWVEQFTDLTHLKIFLRGVQATSSMLGHRLDIPLRWM